MFALNASEAILRSMVTIHIDFDQWPNKIR